MAVVVVAAAAGAAPVEAVAIMQEAEIPEVAGWITVAAAVKVWITRLLNSGTRRRLQRDKRLKA